ncbi:uncharacterized protein LOC111394183 [Olea europaea var. sylvestris]|uniref:uncharacterized protein LOC111394183 n=1 Tax=Olea europaea var. sylvestris TaxID=158386 RepID=UPI000C1D572A|nr:uncharacterized protein LOC111394183 [Olea europaea var. sylvestris]
MSGKGSFAVSRSHGGDRFYNPPAVRKKQQLLLQQQHSMQKQQLMPQQQQQELQRAAVKTESFAHAESGNRSESDGSNAALSKQDSVRSVSPPAPPPVGVTNLDRLMESVTPFIPAQCEAEANARGWRMRKAVSHPFYCLDDLWESFNEWSVYGAGVPLILNEKDRIIQYYVPYLSGIQLYIDSKKPPSSLRRPGEEGDAASMETSSASNSDCEADRRLKSLVDGSRNQQNLMNSNSQRLNKLALRDKSVIGSSSDEAEISSSPGLLSFEYLEQEQPHNRRPLTDKISVLASQFPELKKYRSCDLLPASWMCVAWYPIYRIPIGPTLHDLDASFLTFHSLSTRSRSNIAPQFHAANTRQVRGIVDPSSKISLPVFGLASYKLTGSILSPCAAHEHEQENSLLQAADNWLRNLQVILHDYQFFVTHYSQRR